MEARMEQFKGRKYLNLETYRKNGEGVWTPLWFVEEVGVFYAQTNAGTGKVKRIRRQPRVRLAPCDRRGRLEGEWVEGEAWIVRGVEKEWRIDRKLNRKYGIPRQLIRTAHRLSKAGPVIIGMRVHKEAG